MKDKIILTDWPKPKHIEAHYRGVETETLLKWLRYLYHGMMVSGSEEAGGYSIHYDDKGVTNELGFRNVRYEL